jgi:hypothetical protein
LRGFRVVAETLSTIGSGLAAITASTTVDFPAPEGPEITIKRLWELAVPNIARFKNSKNQRTEEPNS